MRRRPLGAAIAGFAAAAALAAGPAAADRLEGHGGPVMAVAVSPDGAQALTASFDYAVGVWSLAPAPTRRAWAEGHRAAVTAVAFRPGGGFLSAGDDFAMILWDGPSASPVHRFEGHRGKIGAIALSPDGVLAATAGWDGRIGLWNLESRRRLGWLEGHRGPVNDVVFLGGGDRLLSASSDGTLRAWDTARFGTPEAVASAEITAEIIVSHGFGINRMAVGREAGWLAYGALDGAVRVIDLATGAQIADLTADRRPILALASEPGGRRLAVGDGEGHIMVIDTASWAIERDFRAALTGPIWALAWAGDSLIAGGIANEAAVLRVGAPEDPPALFAEARGFQRPPREMGNGERQFVRKCSVCHTLTPDGGRRAGPSLYALFGRAAGGLAGYPYSEALRRSGIVWSAETVDRLFDEGPERVTPGSKMPMQRIATARDRADLIAYLKAETAPDGAAGRSGSEEP